VLIIPRGCSQPSDYPVQTPRTRLNSMNSDDQPYSPVTRAVSEISTPWWTSYLGFNPRRIEMVPSMVTGWNRLSSAASFPIVLRYSSAVRVECRSRRRIRIWRTSRGSTMNARRKNRSDRKSLREEERNAHAWWHQPTVVLVQEQVLSFGLHRCSLPLCPS
jgi:hypothetical protein